MRMLDNERTKLLMKNRCTNQLCMHLISIMSDEEKSKLREIFESIVSWTTMQNVGIQTNCVMTSTKKSQCEEDT